MICAPHSSMTTISMQVEFLIINIFVGIKILIEKALQLTLTLQLFVGTSHSNLAWSPHSSLSDHLPISAPSLPVSAVRL